MAQHARSCLFLLLIPIVGSFFIASNSLAGGDPLNIKIIHATKGGVEVDAEIKSLANDFSQLKFTSFKIIDKAKIDVAIGGSSKFQLPNGLWMKVTLLRVDKDGGMRLKIEAKKLKFKSTIAIKPGGTVAVGGPSYKEGALIFALSRPKQAP